MMIKLDVGRLSLWWRGRLSTVLGSESMSADVVVWKALSILA